MTPTHKVGQIIQAERQHASPENVKKYGPGSILSGDGSNLNPNTLEAWNKMVKEYYVHSLQPATGKPLIYGVDAAHDHNNVLNANILLHNACLGVANKVIRPCSWVMIELFSDSSASILPWLPGSELNKMAKELIYKKY